MAADSIVRSLPPIKALEGDILRRDEGYPVKQPERTPTTMASTSFTPVAYSRPPAPPVHSYNPPSQSTYPASTSAPSSFATPPPARSLDGRESKEMGLPSSQKSLPSLAEAIGTDRIGSTYSSEAVSPRSAQHTSDSPGSRLLSPRDTGMNGQHAQRPSYSEGPDYQRRRDYPEQLTHSYTHRPSIPHVQPVAGIPPHEASRSFDGPQAVARPPSLAAYSPPNASFPPATAPGLSMAPPATAYPASASEPAHAWPARQQSVVAPAGPGYAPFTYSVQKQLDFYDFEVSLREMSESGANLLDFGRAYGGRVQEAKRTGVVPGVLPSVSEVEDLMNKSRHTHEVLARMREALLAQQAAYFQRQPEGVHPEAPRNDSLLHHEEPKFTGPEPKKRRGRNAAPGRCHSCNRAETPEWRRGPDGARTLCNACGLHYAKLTRKAGATKAAAESAQASLKAGEKTA